MNEFRATLAPFDNIIHHPNTPPGMDGVDVFGHDAPFLRNAAIRIGKADQMKEIVSQEMPIRLLYRVSRVSLRVFRLNDASQRNSCLLSSNS